MFDHIGFVVRDLPKSLTFYENCLAPLGLRITERHGDEAVIVCGADDYPFIWIGTTRPSWWGPDHAAGRAPMHLAFRAPSRAAVDTFHAAAIRFGGRDNGPPGDRGRGLYAAYVIDPDWNNVEAGVRLPPASAAAG